MSKFLVEICAECLGSRRSGVALSAMLILLCTPLSFGVSPSIQFIGKLTGDSSSAALEVTGDGSTVAAVSGPNTFSKGIQASRWTAGGGLVGLGDLTGGEFFSVPNGISANGGTIVGGSTSSLGQEAFVWTQPTGMVGLGDLPGGAFASSAAGVSADGTVIGGTGTTDNGTEAFRWTQAGGLQPLGSILPGGVSQAFATSADGTAIVGDSPSTIAIREAFRWTEETGMVGLNPAFGVRNSQAFDVSADGDAVVGIAVFRITPQDLRQRAFRWTESGGMINLGNLVGDNRTSWANGVSADGSAVVGFSFSAIGQDAYLWNEIDGMRSLNDIAINDLGLDLDGMTLVNANDVSGDGKTIVGAASDGSGEFVGFVLTIPEPGTLAILSAGVTMLLRRRRGISR